MGIRSSLRNAKYELRYALYGACGPLLQKLYEGGFNTLDRGTLDDFLGQESKLPDVTALAGMLLSSHYAGKAIDGKWPGLLRGSVQTLVYAGLIAGAIKGGDCIDPASEESIDYIATAIDNLKETAIDLSLGKMPPLMYMVLYGGLVSGALRWTTNAGNFLIGLFTGEPSK